MRKLLLLIICATFTVISYAQIRDYRAMPEDYSDTAIMDTNSEFFEIVSLVVAGIVCIIIGFVSFLGFIDTIKTKLYWRKAIKDKTIFYARFNCIASTSLYTIPKKDTYYNLGDYFIAKENKIHVSGGSTCIILEYISDNNRVKVKFDKYSEPIYIHADHLRQLSEQITHYFKTTSDIVAATTPELLKKRSYSSCTLDQIYFIEQNGYVLIPCGSIFTFAHDTPPHYTSETKVKFNEFPTSLYIYMTQYEKHEPSNK